MAFTSFVALAIDAPTAPQRPPAIAVTLRPVPAKPSEDTITDVDVMLEIVGRTTAANAPLVRLPLVVSNVDTVATVVRVKAYDSFGPLRLSTRDIDVPVEAAGDAEAGGRSREWLVDRATRGLVTLRYTVAAQPVLPPRGPAPPFSFSNDGGSVSAAGHVFLLLPPGATEWKATINWDLAALPRDARAVSSWGGGQVVVPGVITSAGLRAAYYMAGRIGVWPSAMPVGGFFAGWQGAPPFDAERLMQWTGGLHARYADFFMQRNAPPYGVFLRFNPINAGGGVGLEHAFVATFGKAGGEGSDPADIRITLAHEMFHTFQPYITEPAGLVSSWFGEGLATFYQGRLPLRYGAITPDAFLKDLNFHAGRYYTSAMATEPNSEVPKRFWADTRIRTLPYDRGMLYFATVDAAVRTRSSGKRSLDTLLLSMRAFQNSGRTIGNSDWEAHLRAELGEDAVADFRAFLEGRMPIPPSDAFGLCFRRTTARLRRFELGFASAVLAEPIRIVRGLADGSAAARAGLRNGDEIAVPVPQDNIQGQQDKVLTLSIRRAGRIVPISYLPRGEAVDAIQWERIPGVPDQRCSL